MTSVHEMFGTDKKAEKDGVVLDYGDFSITIARAGGNNKAFAKTLEAKTKPLRRAIETETAPPERIREILIEVYSRTVVLGWSGITDEHGGELPFTAENCADLFKKLPDLFADVQTQAGNFALFRQAAREADAGN